MNEILGFGLLITFAFLLAVSLEKISIPRVASYVVAGALFSEGLLGQVFQFSFSRWSDFLTQICLGIIAFIVGSEVHFGQLLRKYKLLLFSVLGEGLGAVIGVILVIALLQQFLQVDTTAILLLAAIAATTAPASTIAIIEQYRASGPLVDTL